MSDTQSATNITLSRYKAKIASDGKSRAAYNEAHGRKANAPTKGGSREAALDALTDRGKRGRIPKAYQR